MSDLYIPRIGLPILLQPKRQTDPGNIKIAHKYLNVGIGNKAPQFHFWEYINQNFFAVYSSTETKKVLFTEEVGEVRDGVVGGPHQEPPHCHHREVGGGGQGQQPTQQVGPMGQQDGGSSSPPEYAQRNRRRQPGSAARPAGRSHGTAGWWVVFPT